MIFGDARHGGERGMEAAACTRQDLPLQGYCCQHLDPSGDGSLTCRKWIPLLHRKDKECLRE